jgi:drug/metabolite transporter (DMT)-like permease
MQRTTETKHLMSKPQESSPQINATDLLMVLIVTISWGMNYPVMKFVVNSYPPSAFRSFTFLIGCMALGSYAHFKGISIFVPKHERKALFKLSLFNMVGWHLPMIYGVSLLNSGRAAIIGYTMPVWALLASAVLYREKITITALLGIALAISAAMLLAWGSAGEWGNHPLGIAVMLVAAITWGTGNAMMKNSKLSISGITLTFWALFIAFFFFLAITIIFERDLWEWPTLMQWLAILYGGVITFAVSYVAWFHVARKLSAVSSGLSIMLVPVFGVTGGALILGEAVTMPDIIALVLILLSMLVVLFPDSKLKDLISSKLRKS